MPLPSMKDQFAALIAAPSVSCTQPSLDQTNRPVIDLLAGWLGDLGFACDIQQVSPGKFNLLATFGTGPGGLVLAGHSDTVPFDEALWKTDPLKLTEVDGRWVGLGSCDMKGFFALVIEAVRGLLDQPFKQPLLILATCDEESSMAGARALADAGRPLGRAAVIGEPTGLKPIRMHKGVMMERIHILGRSGHSSDPSLGHSALEAMHDAISELKGLRTQWQSEYRNPQFTVPQPTLNLGCIHGGDNPNRICGQCSLEFDLRPLPGMDPDVLRAAIRHKLQPLAELHQVQIDYAPLFPECSPFEQVADAELVRVAERLTGHTAAAVAFGTEAPYLQRLGCETLVLGPGDIACAHQPGEYLEMSRLDPTVRLLRQLIEQYCLTPQ
ncbi:MULTISPECIES: acetylornithine deacetylase [Pseudomonas syringae group]|uniref:Acetylornithine deacetylase n=3 Tax=Pseudomonas syringae group TaxID=136849 RepID=A0AA40P865_9PSED|nr:MULTISPECIES: acetylornithine deacetylase [Pseudomonas syringae group]KOP51554.1 acetylornithine deacetylase [Pseudomonas coronafaciens pv. porri]KOP53502.1 acetylornithine deacetylase [Pseudomonas coronafaciens pv. porri]KPX28535.1 Acetylornithine deacetylase [Pseudomonas coronafaciens pv. garcae]KPY22756.1 Acetylornithine deacetylase [Pseudomonas coronafaciens pv. porri]KPZ06713.1 Acetylornithine deacetylase [Pseudomonas tremae]